MTAPTFVPPFRSLVEGVATFFESQELDVVVDRGWKARAKQINQGAGRANRVVFMGSKPDGSAGTIVGPRQVGHDAGDPDPDYAIRALSDWNRTIQVSIWAYDGSAPNDEGAQDDALWQLFTWVQRAVQSVAFSNASWGAVKITVPLERAFGLELVADLSFQTMIPDIPLDLGRPESATVSKDPQP